MYRAQSSESTFDRLMDTLKDNKTFLVIGILGIAGAAGFYHFHKKSREATPVPIVETITATKSEPEEQTAPPPEPQRPKNRRADNPDSRLLTLQDERMDAAGTNNYLFTEPALMIQPTEEVNELIERSEDKSERLFFQIYKGMSLVDSQE